MSSTPPPPVFGKPGNLTVSVTLSPDTPSSPEPESPGSEFSTPPTSPRSEDSPESPPSTPSALAQRAPPPPLDGSVPTRPQVRTVSPLFPTPTSPRAEYSHESPPSSPPAPVQRTHPPPLDDSVPTPPLVGTVSPLLLAPTSPRAGYMHESPPSTPPAPAQRASPPSPVDSIPTPLVRTVSPLFHAEELSQTPPVEVLPLQAQEFSPHPPPPVQVPPLQFEKASQGSDGSVLSLFWDAIARMQEAHASLDEHISRWFGLDQSKYQWALKEYYESTGQEIGKACNPKEHSCKT